VLWGKRHLNLSDPAVEEVLYDSLAMRRFAGIDLGSEPVPDETTVCRFRGDPHATTRYKHLIAPI
jgi:IS5 family transposase